jgi:hypothetical protein
VSHLVAPAFAGAMYGRQILGAIPVERRVLLFASVDVAGHPQLEGRTVADAFRPGHWRILALDPGAQGGERREPAGGGGRREPVPGGPSSEDTGPAPGTRLVANLPPTYVLRKEDRVVLAATRRGLAELLGRRGREPQPDR